MKWLSSGLMAVLALFGGQALAGEPATGGSEGLRAAARAEIVTGKGGYVRVTETGHPPLGTGGPRAKSIARDNARARARERLIKVILAMRMPGGAKVEDHVRARMQFATTLRAIVDAAAISGSEMAGDVVEVTLTVRMDGEHGLADFLDSLESAP